MGAFTDDEYNYGLNLLKAKAHRPEQNAANEQRADAIGIPLGVAELDDNADTATARDWARTDEERKAITQVMAASPEAARIGWMDRTFGKYAVKVASLLSSPQANPMDEAAISEKYALTGAMVGELRQERSLIESTMSPSSEENDRLEGEYLKLEGSSERMQSLKDALARPFSESRSIANRAGFGASTGITRDYLEGIYDELGITPDNKGEYVAANKVATRALASDASAMMLLNELYGERWKELPDGHIGMLLSDMEKRTGIDLSLSNPSRMKAITRINPAEAANLFGIPELLWRSVTDPGNEDTRNKYNLGFPFALAEQADAQRGRTWIDRQANGLAHSMRFMGQHAITNFLTGGAYAFANAGLIGKAGVALGESALLTTADTHGLADTADTLRSRDMSYLDKDGNVVTVTPEKRDEMAEMFVRSFASNFIENGSEWIGEFLPKMGGVSPFRRFYNKMVGRTPIKDTLADFGANTLYNGLFGEMFEEVASKAAKGALTELSEKYGIKKIDLGEDLKFDVAWFRDTFIQIAAQQAIMFGTGASAQKALNAMHRDDVSVFSLRQNATEVSDLMRGDTSFGGANITDAQRLVHLNEMKIGGQRLTLKLSDAAELMKRNPDACKALGITEESIGEAAKAGRSSMDLSVADFIAYRGGSANDVKFADEVMDATVGSGNVIAVTKRGATMREVEDALSESAESYRARDAAKRMVAEEIGRAVRENPGMSVNVELVSSAAGGIIDYLSREGGMDISDFVERFKVLVSERPAELMSASSIQSLVPEDVRTLMDRKSEANVKLVDALARRFGVGDVVWATEDDLQEEQKASGVDAALINGWYVARNGETGMDEIHIAPSAAVRFTFGHELFHRIQAVSPGIAGEIHSILSDNGMLSGVLQRKMNAIRDAYSSVNGSVSEDEFSADMLGYVMNDLRFAQALARRLEEKESGAGEKFLQAAIEAVDVVLSHLARLGSRSYQAEFLFSDYARKKELLTNLLVDFSDRFGSVQPDVSTAENRKSKNSSKGRKYSIGGLYTGTPHDYAHKDENGNISNPPSINNIGGGEGAYVYGYGLYATDNREIAEWYARSVGEIHSEKVIKFDGKSYSNRIYEDRESLAKDIKKKVELIYANRFGKEKLEKRKKDKDSWLSDSFYHEEAVDRLFEDFKKSFDSANTSLFNYSWAYALNMVKDLIEYEVKTPDKYIYEQTFFNDGSRFVDWYSVASDEDIERIKSNIIPAFVKEGADEEAKNFLEENLFIGIMQGDTYGEIYNTISEFMDEEMMDYEYVYKDKSKFATDVFLMSGIYGVRYPAKSRNVIKDGNEVGWNYVTFKDDNIEVNHKWRNGEKIYSIQTPADNSLANNQASFVELVSNADSIDAIREIAVWAYGMARSMVDNGMDQRGRIATSLAVIDEWLESDALKNPYEPGTFQHDEYKRRRFGDAFVRYVAESSPSAMADGSVKDAMRELKKIAKSAYASVASVIPRVPSAVSAVFGSMVDADSTIDDSTDFRLMANLLRSEAAKGYLGTGQSMLYDLVRKAEEKAKEVQSAKIQEMLKVLRRQWEQEASDVADGMGRYRAEAEIAGAGGFTPKIADLAGYATEEGSDDAKAVRYGLDARKLVSKDSRMTLDDALSIARKNGYDDIETMVRDIVDNPTRQEYVAQFADATQDAWLKAASFDADEEAIANDYAITALEQLEETLSSRLGAQKAFGKVAMHGIQQNRILKSTVADVRGNSMVADTRVKIGELVEILGRKNVDDRKVLEKIGEIRANMEYLRQVGAEKALIDRNVAMMKKAFSAKKGVIQGEYQDAIIELGNFFGITSRKYVPGSLAKIMDVLKGQEDDENCFEDRTDIDTFFTDLTDILRRNEGLDWHRMTTADFDRVADAIRYLEYLGRGEVKDAKRGFWGKVRDQVDYFVREIGTDGKYTDYSDKTALESAASAWRRGVSSTYNINFMLGRTGNVGKEFVVEWVSKPSTRELGLMQDVYGEIRPLMSEFASEFAKVQKMVDDGRISLEYDGARYRRISDYLDAILPINNHKNGDYQGYRKWCNDGDDRSTAAHMMMMALYLGTESGRQRIMDGYALRTPQDAMDSDDSELSGIFQPFLSLFTGRQLEIINSIWDAIARGSLTDEVAKAYGEVNHSVFRTIPASPFIVGRSVDGNTNVEMRGGYIPLNYLYHDRNSAKANESSAYATPDFKTTSSVNRRNDVIRDTYPLSLEDNVLFQHVRDSAHYATHRVPMSFAFKVIGDSDFKAAYTKRYSAEDYKALVKAFRRVSCPMTNERTAFTWIENAARYITIARAFIGNIQVALMQATSITVGATELGGYLNRAIMRYMQSPIDDVRRARELSPLMRERAKMQDVDMRRAYERMHGTKFENFRTSVLEIGTLPMHFMDNIVAVIQFNAAYDKAIDDGRSSLDAVAYAENFVASTQGAARQMDMTGFQDDTRFLSLFMSATSAMYNRTLLDFSTESGFRKYVSLACNQMIPMMSAMVVRYIANGGWMSGDGDDEWHETPASRAAIREMLTSPFSGIPAVNMVSDVVAELAINGRIKEDAFAIPSLGIVTDSTRSIIKALKASRDDDADFAIYNFAKAVSDMAGIPVVTAHERIVKMLRSWNIDEINDAIEPLDLKNGLDDSK